MLPTANILLLILLLLAGFLEGSIEALKYRYMKVKRLLPFLADRFWNPAISHVNKYRNGDNKQGERFWLSTTALVWLTDGYHLLNAAGNTLLFASFAIATTLTLNWQQAAIAFILLRIVYSGGNSCAIDLLFK